MRRRLLLSYLALTVVVLVALEVPLGILNAHNLRQDLRSKVQRDAVAVGSLAEDALEHHRTNDPTLRAVVSRYAESGDAKVVILDNTGRVVASSARDEEDIGERVHGIVVTQTIASRGHLLGAVRITYPTASTDHRIGRYWLALGLAAAVVLAAAALVGLLLSRSMSRPLRRLEDAAERIGDGELSARASERDGPEEIRRLARTLNETAAKLEALVQSQRDFIADASHQLRTPLTALRLRLENLEPSIVAEGRESLAGALGEADRLARLVSELLALARAENQVEAAGVLDLAGLAASRADAWADLASERDVAIEARGEQILARAGAGRIEQILDNLLANAIDASPQGTTIHVRAARRSGWAELHVVDEGAGLAADDRVRAFDRFWRTPSGEGSGLGLAIARRLAAVDEGEIELVEASTGGVDAVVRLRPN